MWSRKFLWQGLTTGVLAAALALGGMWLLGFLVTRNSTVWSLTILWLLRWPGLILYPACWYALVYRQRDYSASRTMILVSMTYLAVWALVAIPLLARAHVTYGPHATFAMIVIVAVKLFGPFVVVAAPVAFLHRWLLLLITPSLGASAEASAAETE